MYRSALLQGIDLTFYWPKMASILNGTGYCYHYPRNAHPQKTGQLTRKFADAELSRTVAIDALQLLNEKLKTRNQKLTLILIGGGAMMLVYKARPATKDLDVVPTKNGLNLLEQCRDEVTEEMKAQGIYLPIDWINGQAAPIFKEQARYLKPGDIRQVRELTFSNLELMVASPEAILAMKVQALRNPTDYKDVYSMCRILKIRSWQQFLSIVEPRVEDIGIIGNQEVLNLKAIIQKV